MRRRGEKESYQHPECRLGEKRNRRQSSQLHVRGGGILSCREKCSESWRVGKIAGTTKKENTFKLELLHYFFFPLTPAASGFFFGM